MEKNGIGRDGERHACFGRLSIPLNRAAGATQITTTFDWENALRASDTGFWGFLNRTPSFFTVSTNQDRGANLWGLDRALCVIGSLRAGRDRDLHVVQLYQERTIGLVLLA